jgi:predicted RecA/RadA family phage recombinase
MSALTRDRATPYREGIEVEYPVAANTKIYAGSLVCVNATGYAVPAADTSGFHLAGVALEQVDNSDGGKTVRVRRAGVFEFDAVSISQNMVGTPMYASDDHTFDDAAGPTNDIKVGLLVKYVSATKGWIDIAR